MKEQIEITRIMKEKLDGCPNCGGDLKQNRTYKFQCIDCELAYLVQTKNERVTLYIIWGFAFLAALFLLGFILGKG